MVKVSLSIITVGFLLLGAWAGMAVAQPMFATINIDTKTYLLSKEVPTINPTAIKLGLEAYDKARQKGLDSQQILTVVDYSQPSIKPRMAVFNLKSNTVLFDTLVAHGKNSGANVPDSFSNNPSSHKSSLGLFLTGMPYIGHDGYSLHLNGLEKGFNDKAASRDIIVHAANYVSEQFAKLHGRLGRSWGCFAVNPAVAKPIINTIKGGTLLFAYYPDRNWLAHSSYLT